MLGDTHGFHRDFIRRWLVEAEEKHQVCLAVAEKSAFTPDLQRCECLLAQKYRSNKQIGVTYAKNSACIFEEHIM